ncbi:Os06g0181450 [Oryza sativa Japonica Group]|uniref:Os06g0181450 protein n=1 Tax=Oryza sativa subsp. japonica TaxID=39947 RepID=C7J392_ORYSJ|nr:Os06g0181450 [Oryza sativa Japonica Group]|eukprot:NP_001174636.1 Os06g0181450 [Oryza sativa Japonica Group]
MASEDIQAFETLTGSPTEGIATPLNSLFPTTLSDIPKQEQDST